MNERKMSNEEAWDYAIGLIKVDGLEPTPYMLELIEQEKHGDITTDEIITKLDTKYRNVYQMID